MRFKNKRTNQIVRANNYAELFAFSHNSNYEKVEETIVKAEPKAKKTSKKNKKEVQDIEEIVSNEDVSEESNSDIVEEDEVQDIEVE